ncbi:MULTISPECIES: tetratricopeptide repeat protein [Desulfovibrio]|uniref:Tetratricopeptide repeat-containing protein n=1 Tax=Desulfovibrio desulfuricans TaxID=876 RepID=A0AA94HUQ9_DESDE|nr:MULTISPECIES: tetratricopeptide repeat protein [Desulfovibrio]ATD81845.1 histidine kinase [Desulfovibrio sp. G11]SFW68043.1 Tetratricopeptide repeat-containing protein [Desulfovibrio desulfuricans]SPD34579.1 Tetratricopeptide repeat-containing domain [Desulfovibrio sp. G11]
MASDPALKARQTSYQDTVINYISKEGGHVIALTDDQAFSTQLRLTLAKELGLSAPGQFTALTDPRHLPDELRNLLQRHPAPLLFLERSIGGQDLSFLVGQIKQAYTALKIIILTSEVQRDRLMLLHEVGADNFIAKPVSMNTLIEKMAFTIKPQGKLGQAIDLAKGLLERKEYTQALAASRKILEIKPGSAAAYLVMGDAHRGLAEYDLAREAYEAAAAAADLYLAPLQRLAEMYEYLGDRENQLRYLQKLDHISPLNVNRKVSLGEVHLALGNTEQAEDFFDRALVQMNREAVEGLSALSGRIAGVYAERDPLKAEKFLRNSLDVKGKYLSKSDLALFNQLGISLRKQGRWQDAITEYKRAVRIAPEDANLYYNMGMAFAEGQDFLQAKANLLKALDMDPDLYRASVTIAYNYGAVFLQSREKQRAAQFFQAALDMEPGHAGARRGLERSMM